MAARRRWSSRGVDLLPAQGATIMGIVNVTPDSFFDGGNFIDPARAIAHAMQLHRDGARILDLGAESSRPGALPISAEEEMKRLLPVVTALAGIPDILLSIDTTKAEVADQMLRAGAHIINDISAMTADASMSKVVRDHRAAVVLMHMQGTPRTMQVAPRYKDVVEEVRAYFEARLQDARNQGIHEDQVAVDPGIGFGKSLEHNLDLAANLGVLSKLGRPVCLGVSRKSFIGKLLGRELPERLPGSLATASFAITHHEVDILRVHDVKETSDTVRLIEALIETRRRP
ncbi:MAG: dihydropteroate synthase [Gemmataceae bacterium]